MRVWSKLWPIIVLILFGGVFFGYFLRGHRVLLPADVLVGVYYPWRENKWGYDVAVPYKNPLLSDSYSQLFVWKKLVADSYRSWQWPLWNIYSYSGYPLAANMQSAAYYPLNILFMFLPLNTAWNCYLVLGVVMSSISMYLLTRSYKMSMKASVVAGIAYGYCAYSISWLEFATATNSMVWIPILVVILEKYYQNQEAKILWWLGPVIFMLVSSGNFQMLIYAGIIAVTYMVFRKLVRGRDVLRLTIMGVLGIAMSSIVWLPAAEMYSNSIRNLENTMKGINYGLVPLTQLVTTIFPDYFGNPATGNYWGYSNYHETLIYGGVVMFMAIIWSIFVYKNLSVEMKLWVKIVLVSLVFYIDNPLSRWVYGLNIPGLSTASAGRNSYFWCLGGSILIANMVDRFGLQKIGHKLKVFIAWGLMVVGIWLGTIYLVRETTSLTIVWRNMVWPLLLIGILSISTIFFSEKKWWWLVLLIIVGVDSGRFTSKYLPISEEKYVFPQTEITNFLNRDKDIFRVEKEEGPLLSPNTWTMYGLMSSGGYDPVAPADYTQKYNLDLNGDKNKFSRYAELSKYDAAELGKYNVKYLLALKRDKNGSIGGNVLSYKIKTDDWVRVMETETVAVLKNKYWLDRFSVDDGTVSDINYQSNQVGLSYEAIRDSELIIRDRWDKGWRVWVNGVEQRLEKADDVFRKVVVTKGEGKVLMKYEPKSFLIGKWLSLGSWMTWVGVMMCLRLCKK
ncbi:MAG: YfhO family protein [Microgenomates group bacterium]